MLWSFLLRFRCFLLVFRILLISLLFLFLRLFVFHIFVCFFLLLPLLFGLWFLLFALKPTLQSLSVCFAVLLLFYLFLLLDSSRLFKLWVASAFRLLVFNFRLILFRRTMLFSFMLRLALPFLLWFFTSSISSLNFNLPLTILILNNLPLEQLFFITLQLSALFALKNRSSAFHSVGRLVLQITHPPSFGLWYVFTYEWLWTRLLSEIPTLTLKMM